MYLWYFRLPKPWSKTWPRIWSQIWPTTSEVLRLSHQQMQLILGLHRISGIFGVDSEFDFKKSVCRSPGAKTKGKQPRTFGLFSSFFYCYMFLQSVHRAISKAPRHKSSEAIENSTHKWIVVFFCRQLFLFFGHNSAPWGRIWTKIGGNAFN